MTKKELRRYAWIRKELEQIEQQMDELQQHKYAVKIPRWSFTPGGRSVDDVMAERICTTADKERALQESYERKWDSLIDLKLKIEQAIEGLDDPTERLLIRYRYLDEMPLREVARKMSYSVDHIHRIHGRVLKKMTSNAKFFCGNIEM